MDNPKKEMSDEEHFLSRVHQAEQYYRERKMRLLSVEKRGFDMSITLKGKYVAVKLSDGKILNAHVYAEETEGVWLTMGKDAALPGLPDNIQQPIIFVPFSQMIWLVTSANQAGH